MVEDYRRESRLLRVWLRLLRQLLSPCGCGGRCSYTQPPVLALAPVCDAPQVSGCELERGDMKQKSGDVRQVRGCKSDPRSGLCVRGRALRGSLLGRSPDLYRDLDPERRH